MKLLAPKQKVYKKDEKREAYIDKIEKANVQFKRKVKAPEKKIKEQNFARQQQNSEQNAGQIAAVVCVEEQQVRTSEPQRVAEPSFVAAKSRAPEQIVDWSRSAMWSSELQMLHSGMGKLWLLCGNRWGTKILSRGLSGSRFSSEGIKTWMGVKFVSSQEVVLWV